MATGLWPLASGYSTPHGLIAGADPQSPKGEGVLPKARSQKTKQYEKQIFIALLLLAGLTASAQAPHLYEHDYPVIVEEDPEIRALMDSVSIDSIRATIEHLCSYHTRRYDSRFIYEVQDWLYDRYNTLPIDTVVKHDFKLHNLSITETGDNILAIQWGTKHPEEYVICGAHYDSYAWDGYDPDTIRSPGADDNATGVAGIWETARLLSHYTFDRTIIYANWCAEECGLVGSAAYAADCAAQNMDIVGYFNLDMTGYLEEGSDIHVHLMYTTQDSHQANMSSTLAMSTSPRCPSVRTGCPGATATTPPSTATAIPPCIPSKTYTPAHLTSIPTKISWG
jgi:Predicted aminopeptidases